MRVVVITMSEPEFHETVEWLEEIAPDDGFTRDLREQHDREFPPEDDD